MKIIKNWLIPLAAAIAIFFAVRPVLAQVVNPAITSVGSSSVDGYTQVYYSDGTNQKYITSGNVNSRMPAFAGQYVTYVMDINGAGQIFLYDAGNDTKTQLTFIGTNLNPAVDAKGRVAWEGWDGTTWQVFFFDGSSVHKLTSGDTSINPGLSGDYISYGRRSISGTWRAVVYSIKEGRSVDVTVGENTRIPKIINGDIYFDPGTITEEKFPLSVSDLFLLNLVPLTATGSATLNASGSATFDASTSAILNELNATASGVVEVPAATSSAQPSQQSTPSGQLEASPTPGI